MNVCVHVRACVHVCACACVHVRARASPLKPQNHGQKTQRPKPQKRQEDNNKKHPPKNTNRPRATTYAYVDRRNLVSGVRRPTVRDVATH